MRSLSLFSFDTLAYPWFLLGLSLVWGLFFLEFRSGLPSVIQISTGDAMAKLPGGRRRHWRWAAPLIRAIALSLLIIALAGPLEGFVMRKERVNVVDIMLCLDVSGSMGQADFEVQGRRRDRLFVTKDAVRRFLHSRKTTGEERYGMDRIGLIFYAGFAWTRCPLTLDYAIIEHELQQAQVVNDRDPKRNGTAIGSAIGLAVRRLSRSEAKSKVIILLTDGLNNMGELDPITAAQVAHEYGIRVYTIGAGSTSHIPGGGPFRLGTSDASIDEGILQRIASTTEGRYYRVTDTQSLQKAYDEISRLEATEVEGGSYYEYKAAFLEWIAAGFLLMLISELIRRHYFETVP